MIDLHTKKFDFVHLLLIIAVVCLALGAITPAASAIEYVNLSYGSGESGGTGTIDLSDHLIHEFPNALPDGSSVFIHFEENYSRPYYHGAGFNSFTDIITNPGIYTNHGDSGRSGTHFLKIWVEVGSGLTPSEVDVYMRLLADFLKNHTTVPDGLYHLFYTGTDALMWSLSGPTYNYGITSYSYEPYSSSLDLSLTAFSPTDPFQIYVLNLDGALLDTTYSVGINRYTDEFGYLIDSYAYTEPESGSYIFTGSQNVLLPIYYNGFTNMPYSYEVSINVNDDDGYLDTRYLVYWSDLGGLYDTVPEPLLPTPTPTVTFVPPGPVVPSDIIPDPDSLSDTINITGWYQDQGFLSNSITSPIYSGLDGFFTDSIIPIYDFFLVPIGSLASMITDSVDTTRDAITDSADQLSSYAAPFNTVGGYVVLLVPDVVWVVVFAALSIGYVILLIRISTGSIKDTIGRFLGRW